MPEIVADSPLSYAEPSVHIHWHTHRSLGSALVLYVDHDQDPEALQYDIVRQQFTSWLEEDRKLIRCEGRVPDVNTYATESDAIRSERSEMGLLALWAANHRIPILSFEPLLQQQATDLALGIYGSFEPEAYWFYLVARQIPQTLRSLHAMSTPSSQDRFEHVRNSIDATSRRIGQELDWFDFDFSFEHFMSLGASYYPDHRLDILDHDFFWNEAIGNMHSPKSTIQSVSHYANLHREAHITDLLTKDMEAQYNVFALIGNKHARKMPCLGSYY